MLFSRRPFVEFIVKRTTNRDRGTSSEQVVGGFNPAEGSIANFTSSTSPVSDGGVRLTPESTSTRPPQVNQSGVTETRHPEDQSFSMHIATRILFAIAMRCVIDSLLLSLRDGTLNLVASLIAIVMRQAKAVNGQKLSGLELVVVHRESKFAQRAHVKFKVFMIVHPLAAACVQIGVERHSNEWEWVVHATQQLDDPFDISADAGGVWRRTWRLHLDADEELPRRWDFGMCGDHGLPRL